MKSVFVGETGHYGGLGSSVKNMKIKSLAFQCNWFAECVLS